MTGDYPLPTWPSSPQWVPNPFTPLPAARPYKLIRCPSCGILFDLNDTVVTWETSSEPGRLKSSKKIIRGLIRIDSYDGAVDSYECGICDHTWTRSSAETSQAPSPAEAPPASVIFNEGKNTPIGEAHWEFFGE